MFRYVRVDRCNKPYVASVVGAVLCVVGLAGIVRGQGPLPTGPADVSLSYPTAGGTAQATGSRSFLPNAIGPGQATQLSGAANISAFNSVNSFGRRTALANSNPAFAGVLQPGETLVSHAFFKLVPAQVGDEFFPGLLPGGDITVSVQNMHFNQPVVVDHSTFLMHVLFNGDQVDLLVPTYVSVHNHHTAQDPFRDANDFLLGGIFNDAPNNTDFGTVTPMFTGEGTADLGLTVTFPYSLLRNLEDTGQAVPAGLPAPQGFLEPFHFHFEYVVTPEPGAILLLGLGCAFALRRRGRV